MNNLKSPLFLWIILGAIILLMVPVVIIDRVSHSPASPGPSIAPVRAEKSEKPNVGWRIGQEAPDFLLTTTDNHDVKLSDYRGKGVILNFWATWCGPCRLEVPAIKSIGDKLVKADVVLLAVNTQDSFDNAQMYAKANGLTCIIPVDPKGIVAGYYNIHGIPTTYFIDRKGIITSVKIGPFLGEDEIIDRISSFK
jgi:thiol-disulfide isomerase/thioredoxin